MHHQRCACHRMAFVPTYPVHSLLYFNHKIWNVIEGWYFWFLVKLNRFQSCTQSERSSLSVFGWVQTNDICRFLSNSTTCFGHLHLIMLTSLMWSAINFWMYTFCSSHFVPHMLFSTHIAVIFITRILYWKNSEI